MFGTKPVKEQGRRSDLETVRERVSAGESMKEIALTCVNFQALRGAELLYKYLEMERDWKPEVFWCYGPTGTGKTRWAMRQCKGRRWVSMDTLKWFQNYDGQEDVIFDDFRANHCSFSFLLRLLDRYPCQVENKGGSRQFLAKRIFVTTPNPIQATFGDAEDVTHVVRRVDHVLLFDGVIDHPDL